MPTTMKTYINRIQRHFRTEWGYDICLWDGPVFGKQKEWLFTICDNFFGKQQSVGVVRKPHNILSKQDVMSLYKPPELLGTTPNSFQCRLIFHVTLATAMRNTELSLIETTQFKSGVWMVMMCELSPG